MKGRLQMLFLSIAMTLFPPLRSAIKYSPAGANVNLESGMARIGLSWG